MTKRETISSTMESSTVADRGQVSGVLNEINI